MRASKTTKEIEAAELEMLTKPEARATAAFDAAELQGLLDRSRSDDDDLAIPMAPPPFAAASGEIVSSRATPSAGSSLIPMTMTDVPDEPYSAAEPSATVPARVARGSERTPKAHRPLTKPPVARTPLVWPWIVVALAVAAVIAIALLR